MVEKIVLAYVPVIHRGYVDFFCRHCSDAVVGAVFGQDVIELVDCQLDYLRKEIRAITSEQARFALNGFGFSPCVSVVSLDDCKRIAELGLEIVLPKEDTSFILVEHFFSKNPVTYDDVFLRWNRENVNEKRSVEPNRNIAVTDLDRELLSFAISEAKRSSDWWRQVGAVAITAEGKVLSPCHNRHLPSPFTPYLDGDPRNVSKRGEGLDLYTSIHAEADIIVSAVSEGISLKGAFLYVTTFPCPACAKLVALAGFSRLYYHEGYAVLGGESILRQFNVEIIKVD